MGTSLSFMTQTGKEFVKLVFALRALTELLGILKGHVSLVTQDVAHVQDPDRLTAQLATRLQEEQAAQ
jgi:hypothetical protein